MQGYWVRLYINISKHALWTYKRGDRLYLVTDFSFSCKSETEAAEMGFLIGQKETIADTGARRYPKDVRSISVGDVAWVRPIGDEVGSWWSFADLGVNLIPAPASEDITVDVREAVERGHVARSRLFRLPGLTQIQPEEPFER